MNTVYTEIDNLILPKVKNNVKESRFQHILAVAKKALNICEKIGRNDLAEKAYVASLLHDITKSFSREEHLKWCTDITDEDKETGDVLHAFSACEYARHLFTELVDDDIYNAIKYHCTGRENMSVLEKVVFLADYIEETREHESCKMLRESFNNDNSLSALDNAVLSELQNTVSYLENKGFKVNSRTKKALQFYTEKEENMENMNPKDLALEIVKILDEKNAADIKLLHVSDHTIIADYFVLCTGMSNTQVKGYADEVEYKLGLKGIEPHHIEGFGEGMWVVLDYSSVIVHAFHKESRDFYSLDKVWADAEEVDISNLITEK
ncbi:MAG: ribosome silencing factor [Clostridia bacterium]|nr:ribosome silencing factor [Clostridia bacterium]